MDRFELAPPHFATFGQYGQKICLWAHIMREIPHFAPSNRLFFYCSIFNNRCGGIFPNFAVFARMGG